MTHVDFPLHRLPGGQSQTRLERDAAWLRLKPWQSVSFGEIVYLVLLIPLVNILMMPAVVAGAIQFWMRERGTESLVT